MSKELELSGGNLENVNPFPDAEITYSAALGGDQYEIHFPNGFGASVIRHRGSYGNRSGLWELAVLEDNDGRWSMTNETPIAHDVLGWLSPHKVIETLKRIEKL